MPTLDTGAATIHYETTGDGPPLLLFAPGGLRGSRVEAWERAPWNPVDALVDRFRIVAVDQRNTGTSFAPITASDGWSSYTTDHLALMDHLGIERFGVFGMCIGGAFIVRLLADVPERITAAVALQPIGLDGNRDAFRGMFDEWRTAVGPDHPEASDADWEGCWANLFGSDHTLWSVPDDALAGTETPILVLRGDDQFHPGLASERLADSAPGATLIEQWKGPGDQPAARASIDAFLAEHAS